MRVAETVEVTEMARRIAAILLSEPALDASYATITAETYSWSSAQM